MSRGKALAAWTIAASFGLVGVRPVSAIDDLALNVDPGSVNVVPGDTVTITLRVTNLSAPINGVQVRLNYDTSILSLIDVVPTTLALPVGNGWTEVSQSDSLGDIDWAAVITADQIGTNHNVATLTFTAIQEGITTVIFRPDSPPFFTKLTRASDSATILPNTFDSGTVTSSCDDGLACTTESVVGGVCQFTVLSAGTVCRASTGLCDPEETCDGVSGACPADQLEPAGAVCRASVDLCDAEETCDGVSASCPPDLLEPSGTLCRASTGLCDPEETCTGASVACPADLLEPSGTVCRASLGACDPQETCDGVLPTCPADFIEPSGTVCRASTGECDPQETCDGVSVTCPADAFLPNGTACTDDGFNCTNDFCSGGVCTHPVLPAGVLCRVSSGECDPQETCDGVSAACPADAFVPDGTACTDDGLGCSDDVCATGVCSHPPKANGFICRASADECDPAETCDGIALTCPADTGLVDGTPCTDDGFNCTNDVCTSGVCTHPLQPSGFVCRASTDECDPQETCDGVTTTCPGDLFTPDGTACTDDGQGCTDDTCQLGVCTHPVQPLGFVCRASTDECDPEETCDGVATACPADLLTADGTVCTDDGEGCTNDLCQSGVCSHPTQPLGFVCRASTDECDPQETCDGVATACPADVLTPDGTACTDDGLGCTDDTCQLGVCSHPTQPLGFVCRASTDECDPEETCDGVATACPADVLTPDGTACTDDGEGCTDDTCQLGVCSHPLQPLGFVCRASTDECDPQETCDGVATACPADALTPDGTVCTDDGEACTDDICQSGVCSHPIQPLGFVCRATTDECDPEETCDGVATACPADLFTPDSTACTDDGEGCTDDICQAGVCSHPLQPLGFECRASIDECDPAETCDGVTTACPPDSGVVDGTICTDDGLPCTDDVCSGGLCTHPVSLAGTVCRPSTDECDPTETCDGIATSCPADLFTPDGTACTDDGEGCTDDTCQTGVCSHPVRSAGFVCRASTDECDPEETCDGLATACPADTFTADGTACTDDGQLCTSDACQSGVCSHPVRAAGFECRASTDECDPAESCDGVAATCPADVFTPNGTACTDEGNLCTSDTCSTGVCTHTVTTPAGQCCDPTSGGLTPISDGNNCTTDTCNPDGSVTHTDIGEVLASLKVEALSNAVTRNVTFTVTECGGATDTRVVPVVFDAFGNGATTLFNVDAASDWLVVREGHTLKRTVPITFNASCQATADFSGVNLLQTGDLGTSTLPQDNIVDIVDFSKLASRWNQLVDPNSSLGADVNGDGSQGMADFSAMQVNFFEVGDADSACPSRPSSGEPVDLADIRSITSSVRSARPQARLSVRVDSLPFPGRWNADLTGDGIVDADDIRAFARQKGLPLSPEFERKLARLESAAKPRINRQRK